MKKFENQSSLNIKLKEKDGKLDMLNLNFKDPMQVIEHMR